MYLEKGSNFLVSYALKYFKQYQILDYFECEELTFVNYLGNVFMNYYDCPYHNCIHAIDVMNASAYIISCGLQEKMTQLEIISLLFASLCHDVGHPGVNSMFLTEIKSQEAITYNDKAVLENLHAALTFKLLNKPNSNFMKNATPEKLKKFRARVIELILATDLGMHAHWLTKFKAAVAEEELDMHKENDKNLVFNMVIKAADIGHGAKKIELHKKFSRLVLEEFYTQGRYEQMHGIPISKLCDRKESVSASQKGFLQYLVSPMYVALGNFLDSKEFDENLLAN